MAVKPLRQSLEEEFRYGLADIRAAWERAWFGEPITPSTWHQIGSDEPVDRPGASSREADYGRAPGHEDWDARCRAFFEPGDPARDPENGPQRHPDPPER